MRNKEKAYFVVSGVLIAFIYEKGKAEKNRLLSILGFAAEEWQVQELFLTKF